MSTFEINSGDYAIGAKVVTASHFGTVYSTFYGLGAYQAQSEMIGGTSYRWPGGTRGEMAIDSADKDADLDSTEYLYNLGNDELLAITGKGLSDVLAASVAADTEFAMFLPSIRYLADPQASSAAIEDFVVRLLGGDFGALPRKIVLEIGNESLDGTIDRAQAYGELADIQIAAIQRAFDAHVGELPDIDIAIQIGRSAEEDAAIRNALSTASLAAVDTLIAHHLPININNHNKVLSSSSALDADDSRFTRSVDYVENWEYAVARAAKNADTDLDFFISAWTVGPSSAVSGSELPYQDIGARQARTTIDTFAQFLAAGADAASLWGVDARSNPNFFTKYEDGEIVLSHGGEAFRMMSESLDGMRLLNGYEQADDANSWIYAFEDAHKYVLFIVASDIEADETVSIDLEYVDTTRAVEVARIATQYSVEVTPASGQEMRAFEVPILSGYNFAIKADEFDFSLSQDFEVNRLTVWKDDAHANLISQGWDALSAASFLFSDADADGKSVVTREDNSWSMSGTENDEVIMDTDGDDLLQGGGGSDRFVFRTNGGDNVIFDFGQGDEADELLLYGFGYQSNDDVRGHMMLTDQGVLFEDQGTTVLLDGVLVDDLSELVF